MSEIQLKLEWARAQFPVGAPVNYIRDRDFAPIAAIVATDWVVFSDTVVVARLKIEPHWKETTYSVPIHAIEKREVSDE